MKRLQSFLVTMKNSVACVTQDKNCWMTKVIKHRQGVAKTAVAGYPSEAKNEGRNYRKTHWKTDRTGPCVHCRLLQLVSGVLLIRPQ